MTNFELYKQEIEKVKKEDHKPSLLLHVCCAPCSCHILTYLADYFDITIYYTNENIYPKEEYQKRLNELKKYLNYYHQNYSNHIELIEPEYNSNDYLIYQNDYLDLPEFSERCFNCYRYRLEKSFKYAKDHNFDYCSTVMSVSRYKNSLKLNEIGEELENKYQINYLHADFKKEKGEEKANELAKHLGLYRQPYCGCENSFVEYQQRL